MMGYIPLISLLEESRIGGLGYGERHDRICCWVVVVANCIYFHTRRGTSKPKVLILVGDSGLASVAGVMIQTHTMFLGLLFFNSSILFLLFIPFGNSRVPKNPRTITRAQRITWLDCCITTQMTRLWKKIPSRIGGNQEGEEIKLVHHSFRLLTTNQSFPF